MIAAKNLQIILSMGDNYEKKIPIEICDLPLALVKIPVPYQCPFCTGTVPNGHFSSPAVPDHDL